MWPFVVALVVGATACSGSTKVGEGLEATKVDSPSEDCRLGECTTTTTTTTPAVATTTPPTSTTKAPTTTVKPAAAATTTQPKQAAFLVKIQNDSASGGPFSPRLVVVRKGTLVRWTNTDNVPRSVVADDGRFTSPSIPPGGSFEYTADTVGSFNYHDDTRPYAVGTLRVE